MTPVTQHCVDSGVASKLWYGFESLDMVGGERAPTASRWLWTQKASRSLQRQATYDRMIFQGGKSDSGGC